MDIRNYRCSVIRGRVHGLIRELNDIVDYIDILLETVSLYRKYII